jgi:hypothetical protein
LDVDAAVLVEQIVATHKVVEEDQGVVTVATVAFVALLEMADFMAEVAAAAAVGLEALLLELEEMEPSVLSGPETPALSHLQIQVIYNGSIIS